MSRPAHIPERCRHGIRWPWQCDDCDRPILPIASVVNSPPMHREAARGSDAATLYDEATIALLFKRANGPPRHVDLTPRVHWTTYPLTIAGVCVALIFVLQMARSFLAGVL